MGESFIISNSKIIGSFLQTKKTKGGINEQ